MGKKGAARAGRIPAGRPLYGYRKDAEGKPIIDEHEAVVVQAAVPPVRRFNG